MIPNGFRILFPVKLRQLHPCEPDGIDIAGEGQAAVLISHIFSAYF